MKLFPKIFLYSLSIMLFIVGVAHALLYLLAPQYAFEITYNQIADVELSTSFDAQQYVNEINFKVLPISLICCVVISVICSFWFSRKITVPIKKISKAADNMSQMDKFAVCDITSKDEIGMLSDNINHLYKNLLSAIESLEIEKQRVSDSEKSKVDFLRAASHELKTPVTALNATLENMILRVGKYKDYDTYLPECKEMTENLSVMIKDILETSRLSAYEDSENAVNIDLVAFLSAMCEPYMMIAQAKGVDFKLNLPDHVSVSAPPNMFGKAVSNIIANAVEYTETGKSVTICASDDSLVIENECKPIPNENLQHIFEPFYRPDYARNRDNGGNGLGLYIVSTLFNAMGISYSFKAMEQPQGMRFTVDL